MRYKNENKGYLLSQVTCKLFEYYVGHETQRRKYFLMPKGHFLNLNFYDSKHICFT